MATRMTLCEFCRRLACERTEADPASGEQETGPLKATPLLPDDVKIEETYCRDCERFYQQLVTFGRGESSAADKQVPKAQTHEITQPAITVGTSA
ncbi:MAG: hypothetical protein ABL965_13510 [Nitrospira sp.]|nr:MAG: hypothetical protein E8D44_09765 [Nitrospira sp.]